MQHRHASPLYSPLGCGASVLLVMILGAILYLRGGGPFNPGPLSAASPQGVPLEGFTSHAEFEGDCSLCHSAWRGPTAERCEKCHDDVANQRKADRGLHGRLPDAGRCRNCHTDHKGRENSITRLELATFEHAQLTGFSLARHATDYGGGPIACQDCHPKGQYEVALIDCFTCHSTETPALMADHRAFYGQDCLDCHDGTDIMIGFDHEQVFPLFGMHTLLACNECHLQPVQDGTPNDCVGCHLEPGVHAGLFGTDCVRCHTSNAWRPAQLTHHTFPLDHGGEGQVACLTCHTQSYADYSCYGCHEHEPAEVREKHVEEGITEFEACVDCHPTGHEAESGQEE